MTEEATKLYAKCTCWPKGHDHLPGCEKNPLRPVSCAECGKDMGQKHYPLTLNPVCMKCVRMLGWDKMTDQEFMEMNKK